MLDFQEQLMAIKTEMNKENIGNNKIIATKVEVKDLDIDKQIKQVKIEANTNDKTIHSNNSNMYRNDNNSNIKPSNKILVKRGQVFWADLGNNNQGSEQNGIRPVVIIQNDIGNNYSPTTIVAVVTTKINKPKLPTHIGLSKDIYTMPEDSVVLFEQVRTLDKRRLKEKICYLGDNIQLQLDNAIDISMKNLKPKSLLEKLPEDMRTFIIATLKHIKKLDITVSEMKEAELEKDIIDLMVTKKLKVLNQFIKYCTERQIDYKNFYIVNKGVSDEIAL